jgi:hypothetical protein
MQTDSYDVSPMYFVPKPREHNITTNISYKRNLLNLHSKLLLKYKTNGSDYIHAEPVYNPHEKRVFSIRY